MNRIKRGTVYTKDELNMALPAYGFVVVYLLALLLSASDLTQMFLRGNLPPSGEWTFIISYLGMVAVGTQHEIRLNRLRRFRTAYRQRMADDVRFKNALANSSFQGILLIEEGAVKDLNQIMVELIGRDPEEIRGSSASEFYRLEGGSDLVPGETREGWILGEEDQETPVRLTVREVTVDEQVFQALLVEDMTQDRLGTKDEKSKLAVAALDEKHLPLTKRERQVAAGLLQGSNRQQLAEDLYISEDTVKSHISNIYRKLKVHSRIELAHRVLGE